MINAVVIPVDLEHPLRRVQIDPHDFAAYQGLTGGNMQAHELRNPSMRLYSNGVSITPLNIRAMLVAWVHNGELAYKTMIAGQVILTGNDEGHDTDVPEEIMELIFKVQKYKVEVNGKGDGITYDELPFAYAAAVSEQEGEVKVLAD
ncbi:MAG: hypothetical protein LC776_13745 [Acidobacteria bacterium]|nr:hypothetical protein [Acidobacteriota bacterium]